MWVPPNTLFDYFLILLSSQQVWLIIPDSSCLSYLPCYLCSSFSLSLRHLTGSLPSVQLPSFKTTLEREDDSPGQMPNQTHPASEKLTLCYSSPGTQRFFFRSRGYTLGSHPCLLTTLQSSSSYMPLYHSPYTVDIYRSKQNYKCNLRMFQHAGFIKDHLLNSV